VNIVAFIFATRKLFNKPEQKNPTVNTGDLKIATDKSLRANASSYLERDNEAESIFNRIQENSSSVIGIGGVRGAGKSSLALKVLERCKTEGNFTIIIPSPTAYDPKEFLLTIYQCVCEDLKVNLEQAFRNDEGLFKQVSKRLRQYATIMHLLIFGLLMIAVMAVFGFIKSYTITNYITEGQQLIAAKDSSININQYRIKQFNTYINLYKSSVSKKDSAKQSNVIDSLNANQYFRLLSLSDTVKLKIRKDSLSRLKLVATLTNLQNQRNLWVLFNPFSKSLIGNKIRLASLVAGSLLIIGLTISFIFQYFRRRIEYLQAFPYHDKLYGLTLAKLEWLIYQVKLSSTSEVSVPISKFMTKFSRAKELQSRPMSLPGVTSDFNDFLLEAVPVYKKIVICIDELDKIDDPVELNGLLKGIKGIIGQDSTHFILTISEDAIARFSNRFRKDRDLIESSFEEVYFLDKVGFDLAKIIVGGAVSSVDTDIDYMLVWLFGNGIPREIKRNMLILQRSRINLGETATIETWKTLICATISSMKSWALVNNSIDKDTYNFLNCLNLLQATLPVAEFSNAEGATWFGALMDYFVNFYPSRFSFSETGKTLDMEMTSDILAFEKAIFEVSLLALSFLLITTDAKTPRETALRLQKIFNLQAYSFLLATDDFYSLLQEQGVLTFTSDKYNKQPEVDKVIGAAAIVLKK
jgi:hypothetical protein